MSDDGDDGPRASDGAAADFGPFAADAEAARAYLVSTRGGAPFLSGADTRLLHGWLSSGVRLGAIVRAIDAVSKKRIASRVRAPLSLASCRAEVARQARRPSGAPRRVIDGTDVATDTPPGTEGVDTLYAAALAEVRALPPEESESRAEKACNIGRRFYDEAFDLVDREAWLAAAGEALADNRELYADAEWGAICEAWARDALRRRYPALTATRIWEEFACGVD
ncbi:MAG: hypothetical protein FJ102_15580 [Deltaproteobacteria bacterium]|nr:hypothetical protein [Deltaproteobacteria bacterium]